MFSHSFSRAYSQAVKHVQYPYYLSRNSLGSLPVYTDIRNGGTNYTVHVRNVQGDAKALVDDLASTLFPEGSPEAARLKLRVHMSKHIILSGGRWKNTVQNWLKSRGF
ncbi:hypothetical protein EW146_g986 [Bondarzewia mesenterica]|uniref:Large ribosomal subunit protein mL49 n=1 Tax=Bondarzewia mesenterica TaxID=1095465 RepID=A0A4S4M5A0_9AGAM|nr:hypothetical protein EW146_g986 [Bondarzewia mesenterica]